MPDQWLRRAGASPRSEEVPPTPRRTVFCGGECVEIHDTKHRRRVMAVTAFPCPLGFTPPPCFVRWKPMPVFRA